MISPKLDSYPCKHIILLMFLFTSLVSHAINAASRNGFDLTDALIPAEEILSGGPPRDGIPAINNPKFVKAREAKFLQLKDRVLAIVIDGIAKAYPIAILNWHEIVNDVIGKQNVVITYCPLCGTGMAFEARLGSREMQFGVSGLLYNSDVLLYDKTSESLWSQILGMAVSGKLKGTHLKQLSLEHTTWQDWKNRHPDSLVLSTDTGFIRSYKRNPYAGYERSRKLYFSVAHKPPPTYHPKEMVMGLNAKGVFKAYPFIELNQHGQAVFSEEINGQNYTIQWNTEHQSGQILDDKGSQIPTITGFWFAWFTFHPDTLIFKAENSVN